MEKQALMMMKMAKDSDEKPRTVARASEAATTESEGFKGSDGRWRGLRSLQPLADGDGRPDDNSQSQSHRRQRFQGLG
ncbi:hypothetical protein Syun_029452 [Stephania yunnanensis]|uniref:Uncharacterized protein n=1 Tax=Stephania yunnanensis TaxID=152371 RepID=A0AAP0HG14_9MAGN